MATTNQAAALIDNSFQNMWRNVTLQQKGVLENIMAQWQVAYRNHQQGTRPFTVSALNVWRDKYNLTRAIFFKEGTDVTMVPYITENWQATLISSPEPIQNSNQPKDNPMKDLFKTASMIVGVGTMAYFLQRLVFGKKPAMAGLTQREKYRVMLAGLTPKERSQIKYLVKGPIPSFSGLTEREQKLIAFKAFGGLSQRDKYRVILDNR